MSILDSWFPIVCFFAGWACVPVGHEEVPPCDRTRWVPSPHSPYSHSRWVNDHPPPNNPLISTTYPHYCWISCIVFITQLFQDHPPANPVIFTTCPHYCWISCIVFITQLFQDHPPTNPLIFTTCPHYCWIICIVFITQLFQDHPPTNPTYPHYC